ncbi:hypothetical protein PFLUV_G00139780 [Perca fluviatilis]|uniref:Uncharacterized protein n=1 Tax=Perca fluviatilis TaxID=8168 RepID=A0A6A5F8N0_PERFL|nr:hypothetical protein PFLUV_G00139780 [Perca fluviatilis]
MRNVLPHSAKQVSSHPVQVRCTWLYRGTLDMALFYSRCLQELPKMSITDVHRICRLTSKTPASKMDKGFRLYASSYIFDYEDSASGFGPCHPNIKSVLMCSWHCNV